MPKNRKQESDSDSDSGPEDRNPSKKMKSDGSKSSSSSGRAPKTNNEGDPFWDLGMRKRVTVRQFKGTTYVDIREYYEKDGKMLPGKKGIALKAGDYGLLKDLSDDIDEAVRNK